jgi:hypothetical protein
MENPILLITAIDGNLSRKLGQDFTTNPTALKEGMDHLRIYDEVFPIGIFKDMLVLDAETEEEFQLLRFLLRLNSTRYFSYLFLFT